VWLYRLADGRYAPGPAVIGTNEMLVMPSPSPPPGCALDAVEVLRHRFDTLGYPLHIALVEKLFAGVLSNCNLRLWPSPPKDGNIPCSKQTETKSAQKDCFSTLGLPYCYARQGF
jgi:hypothetical protein